MGPQTHSHFVLAPFSQNIFFLNSPDLRQPTEQQPKTRFLTPLSPTGIWPWGEEAHHPIVPNPLKWSRRNPWSVVEKLAESQEGPGLVHYSYPEPATQNIKHDRSFLYPSLNLTRCGPDNSLLPRFFRAVNCNLLSHQEGKVGDRITMIQITWMQGRLLRGQTNRYFSLVLVCIIQAGRIFSRIGYFFCHAFIRYYKATC